MSQEHKLARSRAGRTGLVVGFAMLALQAACDDPSPRTAEAMPTREPMEDVAMATPSASSADMQPTQEMDGVQYADDYTPSFTADGELLRPTKPVWREWPQVGTPLTPNALNDGEAPFPEFHQVYIDPMSWEHWRATGEFRDGTVLAKELVAVVSEGAHPDGSTNQVSGRGYFMGDFIGFEMAYKSSEHFPDEPGNWAYFSFGHHPEPYARSTAVMPVDQCNSCHQGSAAEDFVFTQFYPVLRAAKGDQMAR